MIYADSSALLKLVVDEAETASLGEWLTAQQEPVVSSEVARVEVLRASRRLSPAAVPTAVALLAGLDLIPMSRAVIDAAASMNPPTLRSLDAIHLASAMSLGLALRAFVAYDHRLLQAAQQAGLTTAAPQASLRPD